MPSAPTSSQTSPVRIHSGERVAGSHLEDIVAQSVEQVVCNDTDRVDACPGPQDLPRATELNGGIIDGIKDGHVELPGVQVRP